LAIAPEIDFLNDGLVLKKKKKKKIHKLHPLVIIPFYWEFSAGGGTAGTQSLLKRLHHHHRVVKDYADDSPSGRTTMAAAKGKTDDFADFPEDEYPSDFRWPESYFDLEASSDVAVVVGQTAFLVCRVAVAGNWTVRPWAYYFHLFQMSSLHNVMSYDPSNHYYVIQVDKTKEEKKLKVVGYEL
jgi:hypothetical protein